MGNLTRKNSVESKKSEKADPNSETSNDQPSHILADFNYLNDKDFNKFQEFCVSIYAVLHDADDENHNKNNVGEPTEREKKMPLAKAKTEFLTLNQNFIDLAYEIIITQVRAQCFKIPGLN